jgi:hypothetical protein
MSKGTETAMTIRTSHLHALLHVKRVIEHLKAMREQERLTDQEREALRESLERAYDRAEALLTPEVMQMLADDGESEETQGKEDARAAARLLFA